MKTKKSKVSIIISTIIFLIALINFSSSKFSFILLTISAIIVSPLSKIIFKSLSKQKLLLLQISSPIIAILLTILIGSSNFENEKIAFENKEVEFVKNYLKENQNSKSLKQMDSLYHLHYYFEGAYENNDNLNYLT